MREALICASMDVQRMNTSRPTDASFWENVIDSNSRGRGSRDEDDLDSAAVLASMNRKPPRPVEREHEQSCAVQFVTRRRESE